MSEIYVEIGENSVDTQVTQETVNLSVEGHWVFNGKDEINTFVETVSKPALSEYTNLKCDILDEKCQENKDNLDFFTGQKKDELNVYTEEKVVFFDANATDKIQAVGNEGIVQVESIQTEGDIQFNRVNSKGIALISDMRTEGSVQVMAATAQAERATAQANIAVGQAGVATTKASEAASSATLSRSWAESVNAPGGDGTKSSKIWANEAGVAAVAAKSNADRVEQMAKHITPVINEAGNWVVAGADTGKPSRGIQGMQGVQGEKGATGPAGPQGIKGDTGPIGSKGDKGDAGAQGEKGEKGEKGDVGATGTQGIQGAKGEKGEKGDAGVQGEKGDVTQSVEILTTTSGAVALETNKIYKMSINAATTFTLPVSPAATIHHQIKLFVLVTGTPIITWGTTQFFNAETPTIEAGNYEFFFDYDPNVSSWVAGALKVGVAA